MLGASVPLRLWSHDRSCESPEPRTLRTLAATPHSPREVSLGRPHGRDASVRSWRAFSRSLPRGLLYVAGRTFTNV